MVHVGGKDDDIGNSVRKGLDFTMATKYAKRPIIASSALVVNGSIRNCRSNSIAGLKRSSSCTNASLPPSKRTCSSSPPKDRKDSAEWDEPFWEAIYKASSRPAMLAALEGCIEGYESSHTRVGML